MAKAAPEEADQVNTRARILAAARELFAEQGYTAASISKIAKRAGVLAGSIYWAFESKEKLFAEALTAAADEWRRRYQPAANDRTLRLDDLGRSIRSTASGFEDGPEFLRLLMVVATEHQASDPRIREAAVAVRRMWRDSLEQALLLDLGGYEAASAQALVRRISRLVLQLLDGVFMSLQIEQTELSAEALVRDAAEVAQRELQVGVAQLPRLA
jgi:AcrR family transcriptional regulator